MDPSKRQRVEGANGNGEVTSKIEEKVAKMEAQAGGTQRCLRLMGIMSGTSFDGIDITIADYWKDSSGVRIKLLFSTTYPFPADLKQRALKIIHEEKAHLSLVSRLNFELGGAFANAALDALRDSKVPKHSITAIACHGQTIWHDPPLSTLQLGEPSVISAKTGLTVVADFRVGDVAVGGHGAPLVSTLDVLLMSKVSLQGTTEAKVEEANGEGGVEKPSFRAMQNIGGIGNVTFVPIQSRPSTTSGLVPIAFDTGPGNVWMDMAAHWCTDGESSYDKDGRLAAQGTVHEGLLEEMLSMEYFGMPPPKTTGRELFNESHFKSWVKRAEELNVSKLDFLRTVTELTARSIVDAYTSFCDGQVKEVVVAGGGWRNPVLMESIRSHLGRLEPSVSVIGHDSLGIPSDFKEAIAFGLLGYLCLLGEANNVPSCTGAKAKAIMGKICPGRNWIEVLASVLT